MILSYVQEPVQAILSVVTLARVHFTIVREKKGSDGHTWGLLKAFEKSKDGWIALDLSCVTRID